MSSAGPRGRLDIRDLGGLRARSRRERGYSCRSPRRAPGAVLQADPARSAEVNVAGTTNLFEAAPAPRSEAPIAYASSAAVYDAAGETFTPTTMSMGSTRSRTKALRGFYWQAEPGGQRRSPAARSVRRWGAIVLCDRGCANSGDGRGRREASPSTSPSGGSTQLTVRRRCGSGFSSMPPGDPPREPKV